MMGTPKLVPFVLLYFFVEYSLIIIYEESILTKAFGEQYEVYKRSVNRWLPNLNVKIERSKHSFNLKELITAEKSTFNSIVGIAIISFIKYFILR